MSLCHRAAPTGAFDTPGGKVAVRSDRLSLGVPAAKLRYHNHVKLAHYADAALDIEFEFPFGRNELYGLAYRTDYDLKKHLELMIEQRNLIEKEIDLTKNRV